MGQLVWSVQCSRNKERDREGQPAFRSCPLTSMPMPTSTHTHIPTKLLKTNKVGMVARSLIPALGGRGKQISETEARLVYKALKRTCATHQAQLIHTLWWNKSSSSIGVAVYTQCLAGRRNILVSISDTGFHSHLNSVTNPLAPFLNPPTKTIKELFLSVASSVSHST